MNSHELNLFHTVERIKTHNSGIATYALEIKYYESIGDTDLLHDAKHLYETEKQRLEELWKNIKAKGETFLKEVFNLVKGFFEELVQDILAFLKRHNLTEVIELLKEIF